MNKAYWFCNSDNKTIYQRLEIVEGTVLACEGELKLCENGYHASFSAFDALRHAMGSFLWLVEVSDEKVESGDKVAARWRRHVRRIDATPILRKFAAIQALSVAHRANLPPVVMEYLRDEAAGKDRSDIRAAARSAAASAASAAHSAAYSAARKMFDKMIEEAFK